MLEGFSFLPTTIGYLIATRMLVDIINHLGGIVSTSLSERDHRTSFPKTSSLILVCWSRRQRTALWGYSNWHRSRRTASSVELSNLSGIYPLSGFCLVSVCPDSVQVFLSCPLSVCPAGQGQDRALRIFTVLVRRRLCWSLIWGLISLTAGLFIYSITTSLSIVFEMKSSNSWKIEFQKP